MDPDKYSTSNTHPPHVDLLEFDSGPPLGMTMAPGRRQSSTAGAVNPALDADLEHLAVHYRTHDLVCLLEDREMRYLNISDLETRCLANQIALHRVPMPDGGTRCSAI